MNWPIKTSDVLIAISVAITHWNRMIEIKTMLLSLLTRFTLKRCNPVL
ncbi:hypothetical protein SynRS9915_00965 [Synechococcus sp. RS9915]|nr:hypothetical protein SynRS9915_00965 [Synechococcus sp. RS9915]